MAAAGGELAAGDRVAYLFAVEIGREENGVAPEQHAADGNAVDAANAATSAATVAWYEGVVFRETEDGCCEIVFDDDQIVELKVTHQPGGCMLGTRLRRGRLVRHLPVIGMFVSSATAQRADAEAAAAAYRFLHGGERPPGGASAASRAEGSVVREGERRKYGVSLDERTPFCTNVVIINHTCTSDDEPHARLCRLVQTIQTSASGA